jgi:signal transduction histidine kinase
MLRDFLTDNRDEIIARTRAKVAERSSPRATDEELKNGVPLFLDQFIETLGAPRLVGEASDAIGKSAAIHGGKLMRMGFTVAQVVYDYGDVCQAVTELADETAASITAAEFHSLNRHLDEAIAQAVTEYTNLRDRTMVNLGNEHLGELAREMRSRLATTMLSFDLLRRGSVGIGGSTGAALGQGLSALRSLIDGAFARVRLESGVRRPERISVAGLLEFIAADALIDASIRGVQLTAAAIDPGVEVSADRQLLEAAVSQLIQDAIKFSGSPGHVSLRTIVTRNRVLIEVHFVGGGLQPNRGEAFSRSLEHRGLERLGPVLGLSIPHECVEAIGGTVRVREVNDIECVTTIDLQRLPAA